MNCKEIQDLLPGYGESALSDAQSKEVHSHLATCASCQKEDRLLSASWEMFGTLEKIEPSPDFRARFWEKVRQEETKKSWFTFPTLVPAFAGFLGVWVLGVGIGAMLFLQTHLIPSTTPQWLATGSFSLGDVYLKRAKEAGL